MNEYSTLNEKLCNLQLNKLKSGINNSTGVTLNLSSNAIGHFNDGTYFPDKLLLADTQVSNSNKINNSNRFN